MTQLERILQLLTVHPDLCDDCISRELQLSQRQVVRNACKNTDRITPVRGDVSCSTCHKSKLIRRLNRATDSVDDVKQKVERSGLVKDLRHTDIYSRERSLRHLFNSSVIEVLKLVNKDYYGGLTFDGLLALKRGYARINDIITLKLTLALAIWIGRRLALDESKASEIIRQVDSAHQNAAGFDIDCHDPNVIAEVKGLVPVNAGRRFRGAQVRGLRDDVHGLLGLAVRGKRDDELKKKAQRTDRKGALKFLGLIDNEEVRSAADYWASNQMKGLPVEIRDAPDSGELFADVVYLVYLTV